MCRLCSLSDFLFVTQGVCNRDGKTREGGRKERKRLKRRERRSDFGGIPSAAPQQTSDRMKEAPCLATQESPLGTRLLGMIDSWLERTRKHLRMHFASSVQATQFPLPCEKHAELCRWRLTWRDAFSCFLITFVMILDAAGIGTVYSEVQH